MGSPLTANALTLGLTLGVGLAFLPAACGTDSVKSPFGPAAGGAGGQIGADGDAGFRLSIDGGDEQPDPTLGGPCEDDGQCDDGVGCTADSCDTTLGRCRFQPDDTSCDDGIYCNGAERCDVRSGCTAGEVVACSDNSTCTIDTCVEETQTCRHDPRDADGDGDPIRNCGGQDCDDGNPLISGRASEVCGNQRDDDCDGEVDESDCVAPEHDTCETALQVSKPGYYDIDLTATKLDYPSSCATEKAGFRDAVAAIRVPKGGPFDLDVTAKLDKGQLSLGTATSCGDATTTQCEPSFTSPNGVTVARLLLRGLGAGTYPLYVAADAESTVQLNVQWRPAEDLRGDVCEDAPLLEAGGAPALVRLPAYQPDVRSLCKPTTGDAFVKFTLAEAADVTLVAEAQNDLGEPVLALMDQDCRAERTCRVSQPGRLFARNLPAGEYRVLVAGTGPDDVSVRLQTAPVTAPPVGEGCDDAPALQAGVEQVVDLADHEDAVYSKCLVGAPDSTFEVTLPTKLDVALVGRFADGDVGSVSLTGPTCDESRACSQGSGVQRAVKYGVAAGSYRAIIESQRGNPVALSWFERPPLAPVFVPFADNCQSVVRIPEQGGRFTGNTTNAFPDFAAGCDVGGQSEGGAPDQLLSLSLRSPHRVILDMQGSSYSTMLSVRQGATCPGVELPLACAAGYWASRSFLDLDLQAGDYFVQIDGYDGAAGAWKLDVFTAKQ